MSGGRLAAAVIPGWVKLLGIAASGAALMIAGAAAWDQMPIVGPHAKITGLRADVVREQKLVAQRTGEREAWRTRAGSCEFTRMKERDQRSGAIVDAEREKTGARSDAFDQGYAAGKAVGRKQCEVTSEASIPPPSPAGGPGGPVGVRDDFSRSWNASAYPGDGALPR